MASQRNPETLLANLKLLKAGRGTVVASFPRSGSTLTRNIVATVVREALTEDPDLAVAASTVPESDILPNLDRHPILRPQVLERFPLIARTHNAAAIGRVGTVFWFRNPVDCIYSFFHLTRRDNPAREIKEFSEKVSVRWKDLADAAIRTYEANPKRIHLVRYEDYLADPVPVFAEVASFMRLGRRKSVRKSVERVNANFRTSTGFAPTEAQPVRGTAGVGAKLIDPAIRARLEADLLPSYNRLLALLEAQRLAKAAEPQQVPATADTP